MHTTSRRSGRRQALAALAVAALAAGGTVAVSNPPAIAAESTLRAAAAKAGLFFGVAASPGRLGPIVAQEFSQLTPENDMKPDSIATSSGGLRNTGNADTLVNHAQSNGMLVRGHTLVWHSQAGQLQGASQATLNTFIGNAITRWGSRIAYWDVVNEAFDDNNTGRRRTQWPHSLSRDANGDGDYVDSGDTDVIRESFRRAKEVVRQNNLSTKLCINDYDVEGLTVGGGGRNNKAQALYDVVRAYTQGSEKLIDCVGFQSHFNDNPNSVITADLQANIQRFADLGVEVHLTEVDIDDDLSGNDIGQGQADNYRKVVRACLNVAGCTGITVWGIADSESWRSSERGLLFTGGNGNYQKKAAYHAVLDELNKGRSGSSSASPSVPVSPSIPVSPSVPVSPSTSTGTAACTATVSLDSWTGGFVATVRVTAGPSAITGWRVTAALPAGTGVTGSWNTERSGASGTVQFANVAYNGRVAAGQSTEFGFQGTGTAAGATFACAAA
ncbi:beta-xylanase [Actinoplanes philippinensis]|uniref:Beta-xylanase n=1 Tax=Actinoplanes philippinensis TaxID=35752 RepID=A0A1I2E7F0_9ACTN|nr:endo-1,4-beta-xylanase [Actinoplanes philippinensis]GIE77221.1 beta-xylanase [Actinoplanes philippinensis]SFE88633.1 endo-1,4-beta-xylanase [Actinoplanes philippinensis]